MLLIKIKQHLIYYIMVEIFVIELFILRYDIRYIIYDLLNPKQAGGGGAESALLVFPK